MQARTPASHIMQPQSTVLNAHGDQGARLARTHRGVTCSRHQSYGLLRAAACHPGIHTRWNDPGSYRHARRPCATMGPHLNERTPRPMPLHPPLIYRNSAPGVGTAGPMLWRRKLSQQHRSAKSSRASSTPQPEGWPHRHLGLQTLISPYDVCPSNRIVKRGGSKPSASTICFHPAHAVYRRRD